MSLFDAAATGETAGAPMTLRGQSLAATCDCRVPSVKELQTLVSYFSGALTVIHSRSLTRPP
jgi:hypothetical protein